MNGKRFEFFRKCRISYFATVAKVRIESFFVSRLNYGKLLLKAKETINNEFNRMEQSDSGILPVGVNMGLFGAYYIALSYTLFHLTSKTDQ
jgi:hypothetical protein